MKKTIIGLVVVAAIAGGGYYAYQQTGDIAEKQISAFITDHKNKPIELTALQSQPAARLMGVEKTELTITEFDNEKVKSLLAVHFSNPEKKSQTVTLNSQIIRGKADYNGTSYGYGKIVTHPDLSQFGELPEGVTKDTLTSTLYIGMDGSVLAVNRIDPVKNKVFDFQGLTAETKSSLINPDSYDSNIKMQPLSISNGEGGMLKVSPINLSVKIDKDNNYVSESQPFSVNVEDGEQPVSLNFGAGHHSGLWYKYVEGLTIPVNNYKGVYDTATLNIGGVPIKLTNLSLEGGFYEDGNQSTQLKARIATDIDGKLLKDSGMLDMLKVKVTPEHFDFQYQINKLPYDVVNMYYTNIAKIDKDAANLEEVFSQEDIKKALASVQQSDTSFASNLAFKSTEGSADANINMGFSPKGKSLSVDELMQLANTSSGPQDIVNAKAHAVVDEALANVTGLSMMLQMMLNISPKDGKYTIDALIEDGQVTVNGTPLPL